MATRSSIRGSHLLRYTFGQDPQPATGPSMPTNPGLAASDTTFNQTTSLRFALAVILSVTAVLLPVFADVPHPVARTWLISLDAAIFVLSIIITLYSDCYLSRTRYFRNAVLTIATFIFFVWQFETKAIEAYVWLPLAIVFAVVTNAQDWPWTCTRSRRPQNSILPIYIHNDGQ